MTGRQREDMETADGGCCPIVELRQYTLHPGQRDVLVGLFDRAFVESQEAAGIRVIGQFRDLDAPDRFVWLRGFPDMASRAEALKAFYGGPDWFAHRDAANATMIDFDDVLLLRPANPAWGFALGGLERPAPGAAGANDRIVVAVVYTAFAPIPPGRVLDAFSVVRPALEAGGGPSLAAFVTEDSPNTFPALPVREGEHACALFVGLSRAHGIDDRDLLHGWAATVAAAVGANEPPLVLRPEPTPRSLLRG